MSNKTVFCYNILQLMKICFMLTAFLTGAILRSSLIFVDGER